MTKRESRISMRSRVYGKSLNYEISQQAAQSTYPFVPSLKGRGIVVKSLETYLEQIIEKGKVKMIEGLIHLAGFKDMRAVTAIQNVMRLG
ncbi:MAG: hypothetical protein SVP52_08625 [Chloroflexota bacterium]|nr:hypothetical protein [Chloroflexota bacterium]